MSIRSFQGKTPRLSGGVFIDGTALIIGDIQLGADVSFWPMSVARGDVNHIHIGARSNIQDGSVLHVTHPHEDEPDGHPLIVGEDVTVGHKVILHGCTIGNFCLIGMGSTIMDGAELEDYVLLGAGSLVPPGKVLEGGYLWLGSPVRKVRALSDDERHWIEYSSRHYVELKNQHQQG